MKNTILAMLFNLFCPLMSVDGAEGGGAPDTGGAAPAGGGEGGGAEAGGEKELSLRDSLAAEIEIQEKGPESNELSDAARRLAAARKGAQKAPAKPAEAGKENSAAAAELSDPAKKAEEEKKAAEAAAIEAPAHWPAADREMFAKQSPEAKKWLLGRHKAMEADYTRRTQELAGTKRLQESLDEVFKPFKQDMELAGVTMEAAIRQLVAAHAKLRSDPAGGIKWLAESYGIDLKGVTEGAAAADPAGESPTVKALRQQVDSLTGQLKTLTGAQNDQQLNAHMSQVQQFAEEKDDQGKPKRPYFDEVAQDVARLIRAARADNQAITLQEAYDSAVWANPTTRAKVLAAQDAERRAKEEADRKAKADAAKRAAAANIQGEGSAAAVTPRNDGSVRSDLEAAFASVGDRV